MKISHSNVLLWGIVFAVALLVFGPALAGSAQQVSSTNILPVAGPNRPSNVPDGYVITPFGYFHPSCVQNLAKGERQLADGRVQHADGTVEQNVAVCSYPSYTRGGVPMEAGQANTDTSAGSKTGTKVSPETDGWIESASVATGSATTSYGAMIATWRVPPSPSADDGQTLFFFPGFEDANNVQSILQPVLEWNSGQWSITSWNCCLNGIVTNSPGVKVSAGDELYGSITSTCAPGTLSCATWNVLSLDLATGESTTLSDTPSQGQIFNWAFGGALEPYYVVICNDYPADRSLTFDNITLFDQNLHPVPNPKWSVSLDSTATPQCDYAVKPTPRTVTLDY